MKIISCTTDKIIAVGLVIALILSLFVGGNERLQNDIAIGLVGFLGRGALDKHREAAERNE